MKITVLFALLFALRGFGQHAALEITPLTGDFYVYTTYKDFGGQPFPSNSLYVVTDAGVVLIDTPWDETQFQPLLDSIQKKHKKAVVMCVATHYHDDRTAGLKFLREKGIQTYTSRQTADLCRKHNENAPEFTFAKDTVFTIGNHKFQTFFPGAGHTEDNSVVWFEKEKVLYGGCFVKSTENNSLGNIADADLVAWPKSIQKTMKKFKNPAFVIPGHFGWAGRESLHHTLRLLHKDAQSKR